jgi:hypothetical protein
MDKYINVILKWLHFSPFVSINMKKSHRAYKNIRIAFCSLKNCAKNDTITYQGINS